MSQLAGPAQWALPSISKSKSSALYHPGQQPVRVGCSIHVLYIHILLIHVNYRTVLVACTVCKLIIATEMHLQIRYGAWKR